MLFILSFFLSRFCFFIAKSFLFCLFVMILVSLQEKKNNYVDRPDEAELFAKSTQHAYRQFRDKAAFSRSMDVSIVVNIGSL
jgi:hypothetical protein